MGDLRHLRHDVTHSKGIATKGESGKCILLTDWFTIGNYIEVNVVHASRFYDLIANDEKAIYMGNKLNRAASPSMPGMGYPRARRRDDSRAVAVNSGISNT
jgi:hypothetical protein